MPSRIIRLPEGLAGHRADVALSRLLGLSRARAQAVIDAGGLLVDGRPARNSDRLDANATLDASWTDPEPVRVRPTPVTGLRIAYQDDDLVVVDKPVGVAAHPAASWHGPTVLGALDALGVTVADAGPAERHGIVQRLDVGTSGLMMVARSVRAYSVLKQMFRDHVVDKTYHAVAQGHPDPLNGTIDAPIGRHPHSDWKFAVVAGGRASVTHYRTLEAFPGASLLEIILETGRTHQIRVHLSAQGHPLVGDPLYGADPRMAERLGLDRQWLHAVRLEFDHPITGERTRVDSDIPADLHHALDVLRAE